MGWKNMMYNNNWGGALPQFMNEWGWMLFPLMIWVIVWKGLALWKAARRGENIWFVALLIINTVGILEILYIYVFSKKQKAISGSN